MNNSLIIKGADFSESKVDKINLQKLNVTISGSGYANVESDGTYTIRTNNAGWDPSVEFVHSGEILVPNTGKPISLFGFMNRVMYNTDFNSWIANPSEDGIPGKSIAAFIFHCTNEDKWRSTMKLAYNGLECRPNILKYKQGLFKDNLYTAMLFEGPIYGIPFAFSDVDKIIVNWIPNTSVEAPEIGIALPEIYAYVP